MHVVYAVAFIIFMIAITVNYWIATCNSRKEQK